jgi:pyruvate dehydrogenase E1 component
MRWGFDYMQRPDGGSVYLRLSTRSIAQPQREMTPALETGILKGEHTRALSTSPYNSVGLSVSSS